MEGLSFTLLMAEKNLLVQMYKFLQVIFYPGGLLSRIEFLYRELFEAFLKKSVYWLLEMFCCILFSLTGCKGYFLSESECGNFSQKQFWRSVNFLQRVVWSQLSLSKYSNVDRKSIFLFESLRSNATIFFGLFCFVHRPYDT